MLITPYLEEKKKQQQWASKNDSRSREHCSLNDTKNSIAGGNLFQQKK